MPRRSKKLASGALPRGLAAHASEWEEIARTPGWLGGAYFYEAEKQELMSRAHRHREWEMNLVVTGWAEYGMSGQRVRLGRQTLFWLFPGQPHCLFDRSADFQMWIALFDPVLVRRLSRDEALAAWRPWLRSGHPGDDAPPRILSEGFAEKLGDLCDALRLAAPESAEAGNAGLGWLAATAWAAYASASDVPAGTHLHPGVEAAAKWLSEHAHKPDANDLDGLARRVHLSRPHLSRLFAEQTGQSLSGFRRAKRVQRFLALVGRGGRRNLTEAAYAAGFASYSQCFRAVREVTGKSPRDCRASARRTSG